MDQQFNNDNGNNFNTDNATYGNPNMSYENSNVTYGSDVMYDNGTHYDNSVNYDTTGAVNSDSKDGMCMASLILGIVGFFINPVYICSILAIVFGAIGMKSEGQNAGKAKVGLILGIVAIGIQILADTIITIITLGAGGFSFCC